MKPIILCGGHCLVHCRMLSSIPASYPLDARSTSSGDNPKCLWALPNVSRRTRQPPVENERYRERSPHTHINTRRMNTCEPKQTGAVAY